MENNISQILELNHSFSQLSFNTSMPSYSMKVISPHESGSRTEIYNSRVKTQQTCLTRLKHLRKV